MQTEEGACRLGRQRVLFVLSFRHSGSSILGRVLGASFDAEYVGESDRLLTQLANGAHCSCGDCLDSCFGNPVLTVPDPHKLKAAARLSDPLHGPAHLFQIAMRRPGSLPDQLRPLADAQRSAWARRSDGHTTIVDSSKSLRLIAHHCRATDLDVSIVAIRRDPRDAVNSSLRKGVTRALRDRGQMRRVAAGFAELGRWVLTDWWIRWVLPRLATPTTVISFDRWANDPASQTESLCAIVGLRPPEFDDRSVDIPQSHVIMANRRTGPGRTTIREPERTREVVPRSVMSVAKALTHLGFST